MRILLTTLNAKYIHTNLAVRLLYGLNRHHEGLSWKEFTIKEDPDEMADYYAQFDMVAFSCYIWNISPTLEVCRRIKNLNPAIQIMLGGPEVSYEYEPLIAREDVDFIVVGEGEIPFSRFLQEPENRHHIPGIVSKKEGVLHYLPSMEQFDLRELETVNPYQWDDPTELRNRVLYVETSRGCPYKCEFCLASLDNKVRYLSMSRIKDNLLYLMQHGRTIKFLDRTFNVKKDFTLEVFQFILDHHQVGNVFQFEITADILHPDIIRFVQEKIPTGLFRFEIGIQTVNQKANLAVSRKQNFEKTKGVIEQVRDKVDMHLDLIVGLPLDEWEDIRYSIEAVFHLRPPELQLGFLKFLKGTPVRQKYAEHDYVFDPEPPYQIIESKYLSKEQLRLITRLEFALEAYWNKNRLRHTLGYIDRYHGIFDFLLGLGVHFSQQHEDHRFTLLQLFENAAAYARQQFPGDQVLHSLIALDYYLQHKIKPGLLGQQELERREKYAWLEAHGLNPHRLRYIVMDVPFDLTHYLKTEEILPEVSRLCVEYTGTTAPRLIFPALVQTAE